MTRCKLRSKIILAPLVLSEADCGVPDTELADVMTFDKSPMGRHVVAFRFCPWCGKPWVVTGGVMPEMPAPGEETDSGEEWKK